jgi:hypothetical protein
MSEDNNNDTKLEGLKSPVSVAVDSGMSGAVAGAIIGAALHDKECTEELKKEISEFGKEKFKNSFKHLGAADQAYYHYNSLSRAGQAGVLAVGLGAITAIIGSVVGLFSGRKSKQTKDRFNEITDENKNLKEKLAASEANIAQIKSAVAQVGKQDDIPSSHVANLEAARAKQGERVAAL